MIVEQLQSIAHYTQVDVVADILRTIDAGEATLSRLQVLLDLPTEALYGCLEHLMEAGFVRQRNTSPRTYSLTEPGKRALDGYDIVAEFSRSFGI